MFPHISELENSVSCHNVCTGILPANNEQITHPERAGTDLSAMFIGYIFDVLFEHITLHLLSIDPYVLQRNGKCTILTESMRDIYNNCEERSLLEKVSFEIILDVLLNELWVGQIVNHMRTATSCCQCWDPVTTGTAQLKDIVLRDWNCIVLQRAGRRSYHSHVWMGTVWSSFVRSKQFELCYSRPVHDNGAGEK